MRLTLKSKPVSTLLALVGPLLLITFVTGTLVMCLLPSIWHGTHGYLVNIADALLLTLMNAPPVWYLVSHQLRDRAANDSALAQAVLHSIADAVVSFDGEG